MPFGARTAGHWPHTYVPTSAYIHHSCTPARNQARMPWCPRVHQSLPHCTSALDETCTRTLATQPERTPILIHPAPSWPGSQGSQHAMLRPRHHPSAMLQAQQASQAHALHRCSCMNTHSAPCLHAALPHLSATHSITGAATPSGKAAATTAHAQENTSKPGPQPATCFHALLTAPGLTCCWCRRRSRPARAAWASSCHHQLACAPAAAPEAASQQP